MLPHVHPAREALGNVGFKLQNEEHAEARCREDEENGAEAAGAHERDDEEAGEEDERRTEIAHEEQECEANGGEHDELRDILFRLQMVERRRADEHECDFDELRGLEAERPDEDPVAGAVDVFAEHKVCNKQQNGADGDVEPQLHDALEVAHEPNKEAEKHNADAERGNLHFNGVEPLTAEEQDADAAEEQSNGFNLKADAL